MSLPPSGVKVLVAGDDSSVLAVTTPLDQSPSELVTCLGEETGFEPSIPDDLLPVEDLR